MKTELRLAKHGILPDANVVEIWYGGAFIGQITGGDGPSVRVMSKHGVEARVGVASIAVHPGDELLPLIEVQIGTRLR